MKKQKILISLFVIIVLLFALSGIILATEIIENNELNENSVNNQINKITQNNEVVVNNQINDTTVINKTNEKEEANKLGEDTNNQVNEAKDYLTQFQPNEEDGAKIESIKRKVVIVIIAIAIAAIVILVMWKYEF